MLQTRKPVAGPRLGSTGTERARWTRTSISRRPRGSAPCWHAWLRPPAAGGVSSPCQASGHTGKAWPTWLSPLGMWGPDVNNPSILHPLLEQSLPSYTFLTPPTSRAHRREPGNAEHQSDPSPAGNRVALGRGQSFGVLRGALSVPVGQVTAYGLR